MPDVSPPPLPETPALPPSGLHADLFFEIHRGEGPAGTPPLVLLPGLLGDGRQLRRLCRGLGRTVIVVDPLGSGRSAVPSEPSSYPLAAQAARLLRGLDALGLRGVPLDLCGLSLGGMWAQHALVQAPERFSRALLVGTCAAVDPRLRSIGLSLRAQWLAGVPLLELWRVLQVLFFAPEFLEPPSVIPMLEALADGLSPTGAAQTTQRSAGARAAGVLGQLDALLGHDLSAELRAVKNVRLVLAGALDWVMPPGTQARLVQALGYGAPHLIAGAGHALWIERPAELATALRTALQR